MSIRWGFLGAGWIATKALAPAVHNASNATLYAVASRDSQRSADLNPTKVYSSYEELLSDPLVDAVYISLTNDVHCEWSIKALNAGKHVLCEKPLAMDANQVESMIQAASANQRLLVEAVWTRWHPRFKRMTEVIKLGSLGEIQGFNSAFTFPASLVGNYRQDLKKGGGSLFDVGPYVIHSLIAFFGEQMKFELTSIARNCGETGIDLTTNFEGLVNGSTLITGETSFEKDESQVLKVNGSTGSIYCPGNDTFTSWRATSSLQVGNSIENFEPLDAYQLMIEEFGSHIKDEGGWVVPLQDSLRAMSILDQLRLVP
jgi:predicted dehydrogenase